MRMYNVYYSLSLFIVTAYSNYMYSGVPSNVLK